MAKDEERAVCSSTCKEESASHLHPWRLCTLKPGEALRLLICQKHHYSGFQALFRLPGLIQWLMGSSMATNFGIHFLIRSLCLQWLAQEAALLEAGLDVVLYDALGCGQSKKPKNWRAYHGDEHFEDLLAIHTTMLQVQPRQLRAQRRSQL